MSALAAVVVIAAGARVCGPSAERQARAAATDAWPDSRVAKAVEALTPHEPHPSKARRPFVFYHLRKTGGRSGAAARAAQRGPPIPSRDTKPKPKVAAIM